VGDFGWEFDGSHVLVSVSAWIWVKLSGLTSVGLGWSDCDEVAVVVEADPAGSSEPFASVGAMFKGSTIGG